MKYSLLLSLAIGILNSSIAQNSHLRMRCDSLFASASKAGFIGTVLISRNGKIEFSEYYTVYDSFAYRKKKIFDGYYVIGSISKQLTAVMVMQAYEKGLLELHTPISKYLPELKCSWKDTVTVHHLLSHTHGITDLDKGLSFKPGTACAYGYIGFSLLARILEKVEKLPFPQICQVLFTRLNMQRSFHPYYFQQINRMNNCPNGWQTYDTIEHPSINYDMAAGGFISTADDLMKWNEALHSFKIISDSTYALMYSAKPNAIRMHPLFGKILYGYGVTIDEKDSILRTGQTGFSPGYASMDYYFPESKTSVILLSKVNCVYDDIRIPFMTHMELLKIIHQELKP